MMDVLEQGGVGITVCWVLTVCVGCQAIDGILFQFRALFSHVAVVLVTVAAVAVVAVAPLVAVVVTSAGSAPFGYT